MKILASLLLLVCLPCAAADSPLLAPDAKVDGISQAELSVQWWQWAAAFEYAESPISDRTGARCGAQQKGPVWFLAGTYESTVTRRTCTVPAGKYLFFPIVNYVVMPAQCGDCATCKDFSATARRITDKPTVLFAVLDGASLGKIEAHRFASPDCFNLAARSFGATPIEPSASNGYYLLLKPLPKGKHTLQFGAELPSLRQGLEYTLIVE
jgi:hypothetical protein